MAKVIQPEEVTKYIKDGSTVYTTGFNLAGFAEEIAIAIEESFMENGFPRDLTIYYANAGNFKDRGINHFAHEGLLKRVVAGHFKVGGNDLSKLVCENKVEAYNLPQGVLVTMGRNIASRRPGVITKVGLGTFVDPRIEGGKVNSRTKNCEDLVKIIELDNQEWLYYNLPKIDVTLIRGTAADENGNISMEREGIMLDFLSAAQAAKACGGIVIAQVENIVKAGTIHPKKVKVPGILVDYLVIGKPANHLQNAGTYFNPAYNGDIKIPLNSTNTLALDMRKVICRRAAMEIYHGAVINLGIGMPEGIAAIAAEENFNNLIHLTVESGGIGGLPATGLDFGCAINAEALIEAPYQFDFYDGGGIDIAFLGLAELDNFGNVNVSKFNSRSIGCGGFINITQNAKKLVFCGTFTAGGLIVEIQNGELKIIQEGENKKFISDVEQITFSGKYAVSIGQPVLYVTERAVFQLTPKGLELIEIAPGVDLEKDILQQMNFRPIMKEVKLMPQNIFQNHGVGISL